MPNVLRTAAFADVASDILDAATRLLARYGYSKTTIDDIAREAGIGKGSTYLHFDSKEDIALSLVQRMVREVLDELRTIAAEKHASAASRVRRMLTARVLGRMLRFRGYSTSLHDLLAALRPALIAQRKQQLREEASIFGMVIQDGVRRREFRTLDAEATANALLTATNSLLPYYLSPRELGSPEAIGQRVETVATLLLEGLTFRSAAPRRQGNRRIHV